MAWKISEMRPLAKVAAGAAALLLAAFTAPFAAGEQELDVVLPPAPGEPSSEADKTYSLGTYLAGRYAYAERDYSASAEFLHQALEQDPDNLALLRTTVELLVADGRIEEALPLARRLVEFDPLAPIAGMLLAAEDIRSGDYAAARERFDGVPREGVSTLLLPLIDAWMEYAEDRSEAAIDSLAPLANNPALLSFYDYHAGLINDLAGRAEAAERHYLEAREATAGGWLRIVEALGGLYERLGRGQEARQLYLDHLELHPESLWLQYGIERVASGRVPRPMVADVTAGVAEALFGAAGALPHVDAGEAALGYTQLALYLRPDFPAGRLLLGEILEANDQLEQAIDAYRLVPFDSPYGWLARLRIATDLDLLGQTDAAIALLEPMLDERGGRTDALIVLGDILGGNERYSEAIEAYDRAIARQSPLEASHWTLFYARGVALEREQVWNRAEADFLTALELEPDQPYVLNYLGYSWIERGENLEKARNMIERAVELRPNDGYIVDSLGWAMYRQGDYQIAVIELERAVELQPDDPIINDHLGDSYWQVGRRTEARYQWQRALVFEPTEEDAARIRDKLRSRTGPDGSSSGEL